MREDKMSEEMIEATDTTLEVQKVIKKILEEFVDICQRYHLRYYLIDGSMLGAVRHGGFIPWDDDIDVAMPRPDYEKFCEIAGNELPDNMRWVSYEESLKGNSLGEIAQIYCSDMKISMDYFDGRRVTDVWMDVMIMYGMPRNTVWRNIRYYRYYLTKCVARMGRIKNIGGRKYNFVEKTVISISRKIDFSRLINTERWLLKAVSILKKTPYDMAGAVIVVPSEYGKKEVVAKDKYEPGRKVDFDGVEVTIPSKAEDVLTCLYGDYMTPPPIEKRKSKHKVTIIGRREDV